MKVQQQSIDTVKSHIIEYAKKSKKSMGPRLGSIGVVKWRSQTA